MRGYGPVIVVAEENWRRVDHAMHTPQFDLFISYSSNDKAIVHDVADRLRSMGLRVFLDIWEIPLFSRVVEQIECGVQHCRAALIFYSEHAQKSPWVRQEYDALVSRAMSDHDFFIAGVRLDGTELPPFLGRWKWYDFSERRDKDVEGLVTTVAGTLRVSAAVMASATRHQIWTGQAELSLKLRFTLKSLNLPREQFGSIWQISDILRRGPNFPPRDIGRCECGGTIYCGYADMSSGASFYDSYFHICDTCFKHEHRCERAPHDENELPRCVFCDYQWQPRQIPDLLQ